MMDRRKISLLHWQEEFRERRQAEPMPEEFEVKYEQRNAESDPLTGPFLEFVQTAQNLKTGIICIVYLDLTRSKGVEVRVQFSPASSENPHISSMCRDISEIFKSLAGNYGKQKGTTQ